MIDRRPLVLAVAPNGARKTKLDHPVLPIVPDELAACAAACRDAGASMIHLHVRDALGQHSLDIADYKAALGAVHKTVGHSLVIQVTSESVGKYGPAAQMAMVRGLRPEAVSIALRELFSAETPETEIARFLSWARDENIVVQFILYEPQDVLKYIDLRVREVIGPDRHWILFVLGRYGGGDSSFATLLPMYGIWLANAALTANIPWAVCGFGQSETECALGAAALGGHVRIGFENNTLLPDGRTARDNAELIGFFARLAKDLGHRLAQVDDLRNMFA